MSGGVVERKRRCCHKQKTRGQSRRPQAWACQVYISANIVNILRTNNRERSKVKPSNSFCDFGRSSGLGREPLPRRMLGKYRAEQCSLAGAHYIGGRKNGVLGRRDGLRGSQRQEVGKADSRVRARVPLMVCFAFTPSAFLFIYLIFRHLFAKASEGKR